MFALSGLDSTITGLKSPRDSIIPLFVVVVAVPVRARTGTAGNKLVRIPIFPYAGLNEDLGREKNMLIC